MYFGVIARERNKGLCSLFSFCAIFPQRLLYCQRFRPSRSPDFVALLGSFGLLILLGKIGLKCVCELGGILNGLTGALWCERKKVSHAVEIALKDLATYLAEERRHGMGSYNKEIGSLNVKCVRVGFEPTVAKQCYSSFRH